MTRPGPPRGSRRGSVWAVRKAVCALARVRWWASWLAGLALACAGPPTEGVDDDTETDSSTDESSCAIGSVDCECTPGGGCDPGLTCVDGLCEPEAATEDTGSCTAVDCPCDVDDDCDDGLVCDDGTCQPDDCGNGALDANEACDDGNTIDGDGCDSDCSRTDIASVQAGGAHTCALIEGGRVRCWGHNVAGQVGTGTPDDVGDNETPAQVGDLPLPASAVEIACAAAHTCVRFEDGGVRCFGFNTVGQLGYGNALEVPALGDDEPITDLGPVDLGGPADQLVAGALQTCVRLGPQVRCWGSGQFGQLGQGSVANIGDDEVPADAEALFLGGGATSVALGGAHGCALTAGGLRCWGRNDSGQLGVGNNLDIGDDEPPSDLGAIEAIPASLPPGTIVTALALGLGHSCALLSTGDVVCWGENGLGQLGQGNVQDWGDQGGELPSALEPIALGTSAVAIAAGYDHTCALLDDSTLRCWGDNGSGQLGYGDEERIGDDELPDAAGPVELSGGVVRMTAGAAHTCVVLDDQRVVCWGSNNFGQLGYGHTHTVGDNEVPTSAGFVELL